MSSGHAYVEPLLCTVFVNEPNFWFDEGLDELKTSSRSHPSRYSELVASTILKSIFRKNAAFDGNYA